MISCYYIVTAIGDYSDNIFPGYFNAIAESFKHSFSEGALRKENPGGSSRDQE